MVSQDEMNAKIETLQTLVESMFAEVRVLSSHYKNSNKLLANLYKIIPQNFYNLAKRLDKYERLFEQEKIRKIMEKYEKPDLIEILMELERGSNTRH